MVTVHNTQGQARTGTIRTPHGDISTPAFLPCATHGALRGVSWQAAEPIGLQALLVNAYHVGLRPGVDRIEALGGLHAFTGWRGPILTDSGGFQAFALSKLAKYSEQGITFRSHLDGSTIALTPETVVNDQQRLGVDLATCLDVCTGFPVPEREVAAAVDQTNRWAERSVAAWTDPAMALYGMVQGSIYPEQRRRSAEFLRDLPFAGFAIGGNMYTFGKELNAIEREKGMMWETVAYTTSLLPAQKPRHLLGVGEPSDIVAGVRAGIDTFDCVMATRLGRHGGAWVRHAPDTWEYTRIGLSGATYAQGRGALDPFCGCPACTDSRYPRSYLSHLLRIGDPTAGALLSVHNLWFLTRLTEAIRASIDAGRFEADFPREVALRQVRPGGTLDA